MIICTMCGNQNDDSYAFCGDCGKFLEWNGEKIAPPPEVVVVVEEPPAPVEEKVTWWQRVRRRIRSWLPERVYVEKKPRSGAAAVAAWSGGEVPVAKEPAGGGAAKFPPPPPLAIGKTAPGKAPPPPPVKVPPPPPAVGKAGLPPPPGAGKALPPPPGAGKAGLPPPPGKALPPPPGKALPPPPPGAGKTVPPPPATGTKVLPAPKPTALDPDLVASLAQPVTGLAEARPEVPPELPPAPAIKKTRAIVRTKPTRRLEPGDLVCAVCGEGNAPLRNFCSRCGESLADAGTVHLVWWRRIFRRRKKKLPAGTRPGQKGTREHRSWQRRLSLRRLRAVLLLLGVLVGLVYILYPPFRATVIDNARALYRKVIPTLDPVRPSVVQSATVVPGHGPNLLVDTYKDTYWSAPLTGAKPKLTFRFDDSFLLRSIILHSGSSDGYARDGRPSILRFTYNTGKSENILPQDSSQAQTIDLTNSTLVTSVTVEVIDVYNGTGGQAVSMSELEFFALK
ncbi:hypothetical protein [Amycolatopsis sp. NPDC051071]|uniref:NADase-type glycan-binding domain-containing protein n=1 Tax=Amycolatopsis sp. NPDC051071 TaxID=3154637 RepID=UPI00344AD026